MKSTVLIALGAIAAAVLLGLQPAALGDSAPAAPSPEKEFTITGAGATFPFPLIDLWRVEYNKEYPTVNLNYQSIGSGGGITQHIKKTVDFAASDAPMNQRERDEAPGTLHIPESIGGVVIAYNIPEYDRKGLNLTGEIIADIYLGRITEWNDPKIAEINPGADLPEKRIISAHRSDGSGTTFVFTDYLSTVNPDFEQHVGKGKSVPWGDVPESDATLRGSAGNEGVATIVRDNEYAIGYVELAYAFTTEMSYASIRNGDDTAFVEPTLESISAASAGIADSLPAAEDDWSGVTLVNAPGDNSYPIASFTYLLLYDELSAIRSIDAEKAGAIIHMMHWMITDGQEHAPSLLYVPLSDKVAEIGRDALSQVRYDGNTLWEYSVEDTVENTAENAGGIPGWIKDSAGFWVDGDTQDAEFVAALEYLIANDILAVPPTESGGGTGSSIPAWIKTTVGFWVDGDTQDAEFVAALQYMITNGILEV